jgi:hypothetical protein
MKSNKKKGKRIPDLSEDLTAKKTENTFVYLSKDQVFNEVAPLMDDYKVDYGILLRVLFDSIIRFPTEIASLKAENCYEKDGEIWINIPNDVSKTFGREVNLLYSGSSLMDFIKKKKLNPTDYIFDCVKDANQVYKFNKKLKEIVVGLYSDKISHPKAMKKYSEISGYDMRHCGTVHLRFLANRNGRISLDAIRQRGGWSGFRIINYYTKFLNLDGKISKEETLLEEDKTKLEKELETLKQNIEIKDKEYERRMEFLVREIQQLKNNKVMVVAN